MCRDIWVFFSSNFSVCFLRLGSALECAWGQLCVRDTRPEADPAWTQKADQGIGWGLFSVTLGLVSSLPLTTINCHPYINTVKTD